MKKKKLGTCYACMFWFRMNNIRDNRQASKDFPKPAGKLTKTSFSQNDFHKFPLFGKIVNQFELLFTALNANSVNAAGRHVQLCCVSDIHRERNHGSTTSTRPITVHERTAIYKSQLAPITENTGNIAGGGTSFWSLIHRRIIPGFSFVCNAG